MILSFLSRRIIGGLKPFTFITRQQVFLSQFSTSSVDKPTSNPSKAKLKTENEEEAEAEEGTEEGAADFINQEMAMNAINKTVAVYEDEEIDELEVPPPTTTPTSPLTQLSPKIDAQGRAYATGRRKRAIARVWVKSGTGEMTINHKPYYDYFTIQENRIKLLDPFLKTNTVGNFDLWCTVKGGGTTGQAEAIRYGTSKAMVNFDPTFKSVLKKAYLLTRDTRHVERKKSGQPKARKKYQWVKR